MAEPEAPETSEAQNPPVIKNRSDAVMFVTQLAGWRFTANIVAGVVVCAMVGSCLGLAINQIWIGSVFGALVALGGFAFARKKDELRVLQIERGTEPRTLFVEMRRGGSQTWRATDVKWIETESEGDADEAKTWWVRVRKPDGTSVRFRAQDGDQAAQLVIAMRDVLGLREPEPPAQEPKPADARDIESGPADAKQQDAKAADTAPEASKPADGAPIDAAPEEREKQS